MGKFKFVKRVDLTPYGASGYLEFSPLTYREAEDLQTAPVPEGSTDEAKALALAKQIMELLKTHFVGGQVGDETVTADDLPDMTPEILAEARKAMIPEPPNPNS